MFFFRLAFWMLVVVAFIPVDEELLRTDQRAVSAHETIGVAQATFDDLGSFCARNPDACETGRELFSQLGAKARTGVSMLNAYLEVQFAADGSQIPTLGTADQIQTGSIRH